MTTHYNNVDVTVPKLGIERHTAATVAVNVDETGRTYIFWEDEFHPPLSYTDPDVDLPDDEVLIENSGYTVGSGPDGTDA